MEFFWIWINGPNWYGDEWLSMESEWIWLQAAFKIVSVANSFKTVNHDTDNIISLVSSSQKASTFRSQLVVNNYDYFENISVMKATSPNSRIGPEQLTKKWRTSIESSKMILKCTTQLNLRQPVDAITRRFQIDFWTLRYKQLNWRWFTDTLSSRIKSLNGNTCAQVFNNKDFVWIYLMKSKRDCHVALKNFNQDIGAPNEITLGGSKEQTLSNNCILVMQRHIRLNLILQIRTLLRQW